MSIEILQALTPQLRALVATAVMKPALPVEVATKEARLLALHVTDDTEHFARFKIDGVVIGAQITDAAGALDAAEALWDRAALASSDHETQWKVLKPQAYDMRDDYLDLFDYIFSNEDMPQQVAVVAEIHEGTGDADMAQDLEKLHQLAVAHEALLAGYDVTSEDIAAIGAMYQSVNNLMAHATVDRTRSSDELDLRNRAYTHMMQLVSDVRKAGKIAFKRDEAKRKRYRSEYNAMLSRRHQERKKAKLASIDNEA